MDMQRAMELRQNSVLIGKLGGTVNKMIISGLDYRIILDDLFAILDNVIPFDRIGIGLLENDGQDVVLKWVKSKLPTKNLTYGYRAPLKTSRLADLAKAREPRIISDLVQYLADHPKSESTKRIIKDGMRSSLTFPLNINCKIVGFVFFSSSQPGTYSDHHIEAFADIAEAIAMLVHYGQLYHFFEDHKSSDKLFRTTVHELRSPLSIIQSYLNFIHDERWFKDLGKEATELLEVIQRNTTAMFDLVAELLDANQLKSEKLAIHSTPVNLPEFFEEVARSGASLAFSKGITFVKEVAPTIPSDGEFDKERIEQVLQNFLTNAVKFSRPGTKITLGLNHRDDRLIFSVADQGPGIPPSEFHKLFKDFGRTSVLPTSGEPSTGLGLAIAKRIIDAHGGKIGFSSEVGQGSTFWCEI